MTAVAMNNLLNYINGLNLSARNRRWLGKRILESVEKPSRRARIYDPETGKYLNDETVKVIEETRQGRGVVFRGTFEDYLESVKDI